MDTTHWCRWGLNPPLHSLLDNGIRTKPQVLAHLWLTLNAPIATKVVCFSHLLKCLRSLYGKQCGPRSDCSNRSSLFWVHAVCFYTLSVMLSNYLQQTTSVNNIFRCIFFLGALRVNRVGNRPSVISWHSCSVVVPAVFLLVISQHPRGSSMSKL